jgi:hypothetical protein
VALRRPARQPEMAIGFRCFLHQSADCLRFVSFLIESAAEGTRQSPH